MMQYHEISTTFQTKNNIVVKAGDALTELKYLPDKQFKLIVSSPPYNIGKEYEKQIALNHYLEWQQEIIVELCRVVANDGSIVWQVGNFVDAGEVFPLDIHFYPIFKAMGMQLRNRIVWHFDHGLHASNGTGSVEWDLRKFSLDFIGNQSLISIKSTS